MRKVKGIQIWNDVWRCRIARVLVSEACCTSGHSGMQAPFTCLQPFLPLHVFNLILHNFLIAPAKMNSRKKDSLQIRSYLNKTLLNVKITQELQININVYKMKGTAKAHLTLRRFLERSNFSKFVRLHWSKCSFNNIVWLSPLLKNKLNLFGNLEQYKGKTLLLLWWVVLAACFNSDS